jgi:DNA-binding NarL/FixJ family response regulator
MGGAGSAADRVRMPTSSPSRSVYVVEDSIPVRRAIVELLGQLAGVIVLGSAASPDEAVAGIRATAPDLVVLDLHLQGGSGIDVLQTIHREAPGIVFVILTNDATPQHRRLCMDAGARHFLDKSLEFERLRDILQAPTFSRH